MERTDSKIVSVSETAGGWKGGQSLGGIVLRFSLLHTWSLETAAERRLLRKSRVQKLPT